MDQEFWNRKLAKAQQLQSTSFTFPVGSNVFSKGISPFPSTSLLPKGDNFFGNSRKSLLGFVKKDKDDDDNKKIKDADKLPDDEVAVESSTPSHTKSLIPEEKSSATSSKDEKKSSKFGKSKSLSISVKPSSDTTSISEENKYDEKPEVKVEHTETKTETKVEEEKKEAKVEETKSEEKKETKIGTIANRIRKLPNYGKEHSSRPKYILFKPDGTEVEYESQTSLYKKTKTSNKVILTERQVRKLDKIGDSVKVGDKFGSGVVFCVK